MKVHSEDETDAHALERCRSVFIIGIHLAHSLFTAKGPLGHFGCKPADAVLPLYKCKFSLRSVKFRISNKWDTNPVIIGSAG